MPKKSKPKQVHSHPPKQGKNPPRTSRDPNAGRPTSFGGSRSIENKPSNKTARPGEKPFG
jgi:hypothetical protein